MSVDFVLNAASRRDAGKGASRRLRRDGRLPAVIYGGGQPPENLSLEHREVLKELKNEAFYSRILQVNIDGARTERVILRDLQRHPYRPAILHMDLQRVTADEAIRVHVPLHFINQETAVGVKQQGGTVSHLRIEVEVSCLPHNLPEFIEVDLADLQIGQSIFLSDIKLPEGVEIVDLAAGPEYDAPVVSIHGHKAAEEEEEEEESPEGGTE